METFCKGTDLLVFSHLRWDFVYQRPQHLMSRFAKYREVYFFEEPIFGKTDFPYLHLKSSKEGVQVVVPQLPLGLSARHQTEVLKNLIDDFIEEEQITSFSSWYYTPMALPFTRHLTPETVIYDCMDELSLFKNAPAGMLDLENELFNMADLIFTGGHSLYEAKKHRHHNIHPMPSSIDFKHFHRSQFVMSEPFDQVSIPHPRLGFFGVIDERFDIQLLEEMSLLRPDWSFIMVGPIVKIDPDSLPQRKNIHYLGKKEYEDLPFYLGGWDCALMPFAMNDSTRFISPTKTPEYLAAGKPVVSTPIRDVIRPYGENNLVHIGRNAEEFVRLAELAMKDPSRDLWRIKVTEFLAHTSWDNTWKKMAELELKLSKEPQYVLYAESSEVPLEMN